MNTREETARRYGPAIRMAATQAVRNGRTIQEVARELNVDPEALDEWTRSGIADDPSVFESDSPEQEELRRLRLENDYLRRQRDLYRKACGIVFSDASELESER